MMFDFSKKIILITGATSGLGRETALGFAKVGAQVVVSGIDDEAGQEVVAEIKSLKGDAIYIRCDVTQEKEISHLIAETTKHFGGLDFAFNNAGSEYIKPITEVTEKDYANIVDVNLKGTLFCMKHEIIAMRKRGEGAIVNHASITGYNFSGVNLSLYAASKGGVISATKAVAKEVAAENINVNAIANACIYSGMFLQWLKESKTSEQTMLEKIASHRFGKPEELVAAVMYLCSPLARFIVGNVLVMDGGFTL